MTEPQSPSIGEFLDRFYRAISFPAFEDWDQGAFLALFHPQAALFCREEGQWTRRGPEDHVETFRRVFQSHPQVFREGFWESQTGFEAVPLGQLTLVRSRYEKRYAVEQTVGENLFLLCREGEDWRILAAAW